MAGGSSCLSQRVAQIKILAATDFTLPDPLFIPVIGQFAAPWIWLLFSAWMMAIQYCDYPYDNHQIPFPDMRRQLARYRWRNLSFGGLVMFLGSVPVLNLFVMPMAICASTAMWVDDQQAKN